MLAPSKNIQKFSLLYILASCIYYLFDFIYMPWLSFKFGNMIFVPLYPSVLLANFIGVYVYNYFDEDVLFISLGKNWINNDNGKFSSVKAIINKYKITTFVVLSVWPSPIAGYLFIREKTEDSACKIFIIIAIGSIFCTFFWGGGLSLLRLLLITIFQ